MTLYQMIFGKCVLEADRCCAEYILNICMKYRIAYRNFELDGEKIRFVCTLIAAEDLCILCKEYGIGIRCISKKGLPHFLLKYRYRYGLAVGLVIAVAIIISSRLFIWDIRIKGNGNITESEILSEISKAGLTVGTYIPDLDVDVLQNRILIDSDDISWISVNIKGNVAEVEIREKESAEPAPNTDTSKPANLVAKCGGEIVMFEIYRGNVITRVGEQVKAGDILVSGLYDSNVSAFRYTRASGKVLAKTMHNFHVEIPLDYEKKVYTGREFSQKYLIFFSKKIKVSKNSGKSYVSCDTITNIEYYGQVGDVSLPCGIEKVTYMEYEMQPAQRSSDIALELAYMKLEQEINSQLPNAQLLRKMTSVDIKDGKVILDCSVMCIEDIARQLEFEIEFD